MFYLMMHSTHFIYGYMASDIWLRTILIVKKETRCCHIGYSYRLKARVLLYTPSHRQDNTYHGLCYTSRGALAGTRNSSMVSGGMPINIFLIFPANRVSPPEGASGMPQDDIFIINLKLDIIKLLQHKLEILNGNGWQELAALRGWDYSRTRDFENRCHMGRESPFRSLLLEHEFQLYTLRQLKYDLDRLPRKDILHALDKKLKEVYH